MQASGKTDQPEREVAEKFAILRKRLLLEHLNGMPDSETHALVMGEANAAALLAWCTQYPLLTFPCLFEERAAVASERARRRVCRYWACVAVENSARAA